MLGLLLNDALNLFFGLAIGILGTGHIFTVTASWTPFTPRVRCPQNRVDSRPRLIKSPPCEGSSCTREMSSPALRGALRDQSLQEFRALRR